jgi:hypothetical protein
MTLAAYSAENRQILKQFIELVEVCIAAVIHDYKNCPADTIDSIELPDECSLKRRLTWTEPRNSCWQR